MNEVGPDGARRIWNSLKGSVAFQERAPGVLYFKLSGHMESDAVREIKQAVAPFVAAREQFDFFFDTAEVTGYHPKFRQLMTAWHEEVKPNTRSAAVLVTSKLVSMAIAVANLVTGGILRTFSDRRSFEEALTKAEHAASSTAMPERNVPPGI